MKKLKFKQFLKENLGIFAVAMWCCLICYMIFFHIEDVSIWLKISFSAICIISTVVGISIMYKVDEKNKKELAEAKEKRLQELKMRYKYYIDLVDNQLQETLNKFGNELLDVIKYEIDTSFKYLNSFDDKMVWICKNRIIGNPDSFIIASCLMYGIIDHPIVKTKITEDIQEVKDFMFSINLDIAMNCAFKIISEPSTYYKNELGIWTEEKHPKVNIEVPSGLIRNSELYQRIINTIYRDDLVDNRTSIMQFSNLLHLIYLNSQ